MDLLALILVSVMPIAFLAYTLRFKSFPMALLPAAPMAMLLIIVLAINQGTQANPPSIDITYTVANQTKSYEINNTYVFTDTTGFHTVTDKHPIPYLFLQVLNDTMLVFTVGMAFIIWRRLTKDFNKEEV